MKRRAVVALSIAALAAPRALFAQSKRVFRVALFEDATESARPRIWEIFRDRLRELVLKDGNDVAYEARYARGDPGALPKLAAQLVELKPDLIVGSTTPSTLAAQRATSVIPIVFLGAGDPVATGLVASLARPGANVTGISIRAPDLAGKHLELLREIAPGAARVAFVTDTSNTAALAAAGHLQAVARAAGVTVEVFDGHKRDALEQSFVSIRKKRMQALILGMNSLLLEHRQPIAQFAARERMPTVFGRPEFVEAGGLISYGHDSPAAVRRCAEYAHRILNGAKPADMPVEQITVTRTVINLKTAKALGIKIPDAVRLRADQVIE